MRNVLLADELFFYSPSHYQNNEWWYTFPEEKRKEKGGTGGAYTGLPQQGEQLTTLHKVHDHV